MKNWEGNWPNKNPWTHEQTARLRKMREAGASFDEIARATGHTAKSCDTKAVQLGIQLPGPMRRLRSYDSSASWITARKAFLKECRTPASETRRKSIRRPCMNNRCRRPFLSEGPHHRLCPVCRRENNDTVFTVTAGPHS